MNVFPDTKVLLSLAVDVKQMLVHLMDRLRFNDSYSVYKHKYINLKIKRMTGISCRLFIPLPFR